MSLLNQASPFTNENSLSTNGKKWVPKMMDTFKRITSEQSSMGKSYLQKPTMVENMVTEQDTRKKRVDDMIKNMNDTNTDSSSDGLADYHSTNDESTYSKIAKTPSPAPTKERGSSFSKSYGPTPYYHGLSTTTTKKTAGTEEFTHESSNQLMEKLNYMIHLLEEQQKESTQNIPEEFALYSLLGIFIIYIVDSFTRAGKYIR
jgi:hypothetical protein